MSTSDLAAWGAVMMALFGILASIGGVGWQIKKQWLLHSATMVTDLVSQFNSESFERRRRRFIKLLLQHRQGEDVSLSGNYGFGVLGFFEHIGHLVRRGALDETMIWNKFGWEVVCYYRILTSGKNLITELREQQSNPAEYTELQWLYFRMLRVFRVHGTIVNEATDPPWMHDFIEQESSLGDANL